MLNLKRQEINIKYLKYQPATEQYLYSLIQFLCTSNSFHLYLFLSASLYPPGSISISLCLVLSTCISFHLPFLRYFVSTSMDFDLLLSASTSVYLYRHARLCAFIFLSLFLPPLPNTHAAHSISLCLHVTVEQYLSISRQA